MATKSKKAKTSTASKKGARGAASKKPAKAATRPVTKTAAKKKAKVPKNLARTAPPKASKTTTPPKPAKKQATAPRPKTFIEKVRDCDAGTGIWFITAGSVEHARIEGRSDDGAAVIRTDAGATEIVPMSNLFETADQARAARY
jgi:hypothetical protein